MFMRKIKPAFFRIITVILIASACFSGGSYNPIQYRGFGADGVVSGSLHIIDIGGTKIMLDAGAFYGKDKIQFPLDIGKNDIAGLKCIIISHVHLDHTGRLPEIVRYLGYKGPIFCTGETAILLPVMLKMAVKYGDFGMENFYYSKNNAKNRFSGKDIAVHSMPDCEYGRQIGKKCAIRCRRSELGSRGYFLCGKCAEMEAAETMRNIVIVEPGKNVRLSGSVDAEFFYTSHLPGSVMTLLKDKNSGRSVLYSGDIGSDLSPFLIHNIPVARRADIAIVEATYGIEERQDEAGARQKFREYIASKLREKKIIIPVFSLDKAQQVFYELSEGIKEKIIPGGVCIRAFSASMEAINGLYCGRLRVEKGNLTPDFISKGPFDPALARFTKGGGIEYGDITVLSSGIADRMISKDTLIKIIGDRDFCCVFVSRQDPDTPAGIISNMSGNRVVIGGKTYAANAEVRNFDCFSSHARYSSIREMLKGLSGLRTILVVHIDGNSVRAVEQKYNSDFPDVKVVAPGPYEKLNL